MKAFSMFLIVLFNVLYHVCAKSISQQEGLLASLVVIYAAALGVSLILYLAFGSGVSLPQSFQKTGGWQLLLGAVVVGCEAGFQLAYKCGWSVGKLSPIASALVLLVLFAVSVLFYHEPVTKRYVLGMALIGGGILLTIQ